MRTEFSDLIRGGLAASVYAIVPRRVGRPLPAPTQVAVSDDTRLNATRYQVLLTVLMAVPLLAFGATVLFGIETSRRRPGEIGDGLRPVPEPEAV